MAAHNGQRRVPTEVGILPRRPAQDEAASPVVGDEGLVGARRAETGRARRRLPRSMAIIHHDGMFRSDATTRGVRVSVHSEYAPGRSRPQDNQWFFVYTITIRNEGAVTVQLVTRHWIITDANGKVEEVRGPGVVGQQPVLNPGDEFTYTSGCPLTTPFGTMQGTYQMITAAAEEFDARIAPFTLSEPYTVH
jgi:ApaG protein